MTTKKTYICNFCRKEHPPEAMAGLYWVGKNLEPRPVNQTENHLCRNCFASIDVAWDKYVQECKDNEILPG